MAGRIDGNSSRTNSTRDGAPAADLAPAQMPVEPPPQPAAPGLLGGVPVLDPGRAADGRDVATKDFDAARIRQQLEQAFNTGGLANAASTGLRLVLGLGASSFGDQQDQMVAKPVGTGDGVPDGEIADAARFTTTATKVSVGNVDKNGLTEIQVTAEARGGDHQALYGDRVARLAPFGWSDRQRTGGVSSIEYKVLATPFEVARLRDGSRPLPSLTDPDSISAGMAITVREGQSGSRDLSANWSFIRGEQDLRNDETAGFSVARLDSRTIRVASGSWQDLQSGLRVGVGNALIGAGVGSQDGVSSHKTRSADLDVSTPAGKAAYEKFLATGAVPQAGTPGVVGTGSEEDVSFQQARGGSVNAGPLRLDWSAAYASQRQVSNDADGTRTLRVTGNFGAARTEVKDTIFPNGKTQLSATIELPAGAGERALLQGAGISVPTDASTVKLRMDEAGLVQLRDQARVALRQMNGGRGDWNPLTPGEHVLQQLASADSASDVARVIRQEMGTNYLLSTGALTNTLAEIAARSGAPLPMTLGG